MIRKNETKNKYGLVSLVACHMNKKTLSLSSIDQSKKMIKWRNGRPKCIKEKIHGLMHIYGLIMLSCFYIVEYHLTKQLDMHKMDIPKGTCC